MTIQEKWNGNNSGKSLYEMGKNRFGISQPFSSSRI